MPDLLVEKRGHVMIATMNRPQRKNAMTLQMFGRMRDAWKEASADDDIRCIVLTGTGGDFSAGMDLRSLAGDADEHDDRDDARIGCEEPLHARRVLLQAVLRRTKLMDPGSELLVLVPRIPYTAPSYEGQ